MEISSVCPVAAERSCHLSRGARMAMHEHEVDRRTLFRVGLGTAVAAVVGTEVALAGPAGATPSPDFPWIIDCDTWGARPPSSPIQITGNTTNKIILHHM